MPNFGNEVAGGSVEQFEATTTAVVAAPAANGTLSSISSHLRESTTNNAHNYQFGIYDASENLLANTSSANDLTTTPAWKTIALAQALTGGVNYRLSIFGSGGTGACQVSYDALTGAGRNNTGLTFPTWENPATWTNNPTNRNYSIYGTYTQAGAAGAITEAGAAISGFSAAAVGQAQTHQSANASEANSAGARAAASINQTANAAASYSAIATVASAIVEAAAASDSLGGPAAALADIQADATGNAILDALAQAAAAIVQGTAAGESWSAQTRAVAELIAAGAAVETIAGSSSDAEAAAIAEGTTAAESFIGAVQAIAALTEAASAQAAFTATVHALAELGATGSAADVFSGADNDLQTATIETSASAQAAFSVLAILRGTLAAAIEATAVWTAAGAASAAISESAVAQAVFSATSGHGNYLVVGAIAITAVLSASVRVRAVVEADIGIDPALRADRITLQ